MLNFETLRAAGNSLNEHNDCAVIAVAAATNTPYETVHALMKKNGRRTRGRTKFKTIEKTVSDLGFNLNKVNPFYMVRRYAPKSTYVTMNHFEKYPSMFEGRTWMAWVSGGGHVAAVVNNKVEDWSKGRSLRVSNLYAVVEA